MKKNFLSFLALALLLTVALTGCRGITFSVPGFERVRGSGDVVEEDRTVSGFDEVYLGGSGDLIVTEGDTEALTIEAEENLLPYIETEVRGSRLEIKTRRGINLQPTEPIRYHLTVKSLERIDLAGSGTIQAASLASNQLKLVISGSGSVRMDDITTADLSVVLSGSGEFDLGGTADHQDVVISGSGNYDGRDLQTAETEINISGSGEAVVWSDETLNVRVSGSGDVDYYGDPEVDQKVSGSGHVSHQD